MHSTHTWYIIAGDLPTEERKQGQTLLGQYREQERERDSLNKAAKAGQTFLAQYTGNSLATVSFTHIFAIFTCFAV